MEAELLEGFPPDFGSNSHSVLRPFLSLSLYSNKEVWYSGQTITNNEHCEIRFS